MIRGLYSAGSAIEMAQLNQDLVAENLANASTPGYRRQSVSYAALQQALSASGQASAASTGTAQGSPSSGVFTSFAPGAVQQTGNPLDVALSGDGFFVLEGPNGPVYTRNGSFDVNARGELKSKSGMPVKGVGSRITIPTDATRIVIGKDGTVMADNTEVGRLQLAQFDDPKTLRRVGTTLFEGANPRAPAPGAVQVEQGFREGSNVQVVNEMVGMMIGMRQYEAAEKAMRALTDAVGQYTRPQA
jgi:flagellar basal-body rod protein FlgF